jgi:mevalonate kinase
MPSKFLKNFGRLDRSMQISIPGKIFIAGEYAALRGGSALTVATKPCFVWDSNSNGSTQFHPASPAGLLSLKVLPGTIQDPYLRLGGMGFSTAEFLLQRLSDEKAVWNSSLETVLPIWNQYRDLQKNQKIIPSGVDLITQMLGGYVTSHMDQKKVRHGTWPFENLSWFVFLTGNKLKTHAHLETDVMEKIDQECLKLSTAVNSAFEKSQEDLFVQSMRVWRQWLKSQGLEVDNTTKLIETIESTCPVLMAKGCGAMGSDAVFVLFDKKHQGQVQEVVQNLAPTSSPLLSMSCVDEKGVRVQV